MAFRLTYRRQCRYNTKSNKQHLGCTWRIHLGVQLGLPMGIIMAIHPLLELHPRCKWQSVLGCWAPVWFGGNLMFLEQPIPPHP